MLSLILNNIFRRPLRNGLTVSGIAVATAMLISITAFGVGYRRALNSELERAGLHMMVVPLGCPYDAAARVLKNNTLETSLPMSALAAVRSDSAVAVAAPMLMAALPREHERRTDLWVGLDEAALQLKPWWHVKAGTNWFTAEDQLILGADAAAVEMRVPGDKLFSPELRREFRVAGVLERSGTSDDSVFFVPLATAQKMFTQQDRLTAIAIRLRDPTLMREAAERLQKIPGAQVVTMTEMMGTFLNLVGAVRTLVLAIAAIAVCVSALSVFNTLLAGVIERTSELTVMRAIGASRSQLFALLTAEAFALGSIGGLFGLSLAFAAGPVIERLVKGFLPFAPSEQLLKLTFAPTLQCLLITTFVGVMAAIYPAWRAARVQPAMATKGA